MRWRQTPDEVQALLGKPVFFGSNQMVYATDGGVVYGWRDEMWMRFRDGGLVELTAYRMGVALLGHDKGHRAVGDHRP